MARPGRLGRRAGASDGVGDWRFYQRQSVLKSFGPRAQDHSVYNGVPHVLGRFFGTLNHG